MKILFNMIQKKLSLLVYFKNREFFDNIRNNVKTAIRLTKIEYLFSLLFQQIIFYWFDASNNPSRYFCKLFIIFIKEIKLFLFIVALKNVVMFNSITIGTNCNYK